jgi:hypothetical protein
MILLWLKLYILYILYLTIKHFFKWRLMKKKYSHNDCHILNDIYEIYITISRVKSINKII